jgi:hypothetical protein
LGEIRAEGIDQNDPLRGDEEEAVPEAIASAVEVIGDLDDLALRSRRGGLGVGEWQAGTSGES